MEGYYSTPDLQNGFFQQLQSNNSVFFGQLRNGTFDGIACLIFEDGTVFLGEFRKGKWEGPCKKFSEKGEFYGSYKDVGFAGYAENHLRSGIVYIGEATENHTISGKGKILFPNGHRFEGELDNYKPAEGRLYFSEGETDYYEGNLDENMQPIGFGKRYVEGSVYEGNFLNGMLDGEATYKKPNGENFKGNYLKGAIHGKGKIEFGENNFYEGEFKDGVFEGEGVLRQQNSTYTGPFKNGKFHGYGELVQDDGTMLKGDFVDGNVTGKAELVSEVSSYKGDMKAGFMEGEGELTDKNGFVYKGEFLQGMKHGKGKFFSPKGELISSGIWEKGEFQNNGAGSMANGVGEENILKFENFNSLGAGGRFAFGNFGSGLALGLNRDPNILHRRIKKFNNRVMRKGVVLGAGFFAIFKMNKSEF